jgi:hypothetical protein
VLIAIVLGLKSLVEQNELGAAGRISKLNGDDGVAAEGGALFPVPGEYQALVGDNFLVHPRDNAGVSVSQLAHGEAISAANAQVDFD